MLEGLAIALFWEGRGGVPDSVRNREAFLLSFFKIFAKGLLIHWILCLKNIPYSLRILPRAAILGRGRNESFIGTRGVEYFLEIIAFIISPLGLNFMVWIMWLLVFLNVKVEDMIEDVVLFPGRFCFHEWISSVIVAGWTAGLYIHSIID